VRSEPPGDQHERILETAARLFSEKGYHATSVREIGDEVGVSQSSLYYHAQSKPKILMDLHQRSLKRLTAALEDVVARDATSSEKVLLVIEQLLEAIALHQAEVTVLIRERRSIAAADAPMVQDQRDHVDGLIDAVLAQGIGDGTFRDVDVRVMRLALTGMCNWASEWYRPEGPFGYPELARRFTDIFVNGVARG
jgi:AcrR family transcriptional regulator